MREQNRRNGGREVQARYARSHRDADAGVRPRGQLIAEPVALSAESQHGSRVQCGGFERLTAWVECEQRPVEPFESP